MKLLNTLLLLARPSAPTTGVAAGAVYYDTGGAQPLYYDGTSWSSFAGGAIGVPEVISGTYAVPDNRQVIYFDRFQNDGVLTITGTGTMVGIR
jgi:hypothetical protein